MRFIKGFASIAAFADNTLGTTAPIGELSAYSSTFSKEKGVFGSAIAGDVEFISFSNKSNTGVVGTTDTTTGNEIAASLNWIYEQAMLGHLGNTLEEMNAAMVAEFTAFTDIVVGEITQTNTVTMPTWVSWTLTTGPSPYFVKVWFTEEAFRGQYDEYEIRVIPPIALVDGFFNNYVAVKALLDARTLTQVIAATNAAAAEYPYTALQTINVNWINSGNVNTFLVSTWTVVVYGNYGLNLTNIKAAIVEYILANSSHTDTEWRLLFPSLFISTEFIISPHWDRYSVPNQSLVTGLYSSVFTPQQIIDYALTTRGAYPDSFVRSAVRGVPTTYKTLACSIVGNPDNTDGISTFNAKFPDYTPIPSTSLDFARMSLRSQNFSTMLTNMLEVAETMTPISSLPVGMIREWRDGIMFVTSNLDEVLYLVTAKYLFTNP